jgi:hypothetical protein
MGQVKALRGLSGMMGAALPKAPGVQPQTAGRRSAPTAAQVQRGQLESGIHAVDAYARIGGADGLALKQQLGRKLMLGQGSSFVAELRSKGVIKD